MKYQTVFFLIIFTIALIVKGSFANTDYNNKHLDNMLDLEEEEEDSHNTGDYNDLANNNELLEDNLANEENDDFIELSKNYHNLSEEKNKRTSIKHNNKAIK